MLQCNLPGAGCTVSASRALGDHLVHQAVIARFLGRHRVFSKDQADRLPPYFRLDVRVAKTWLTDKLSIELYLDVLNVLFNQEILGYTYPDGATARIPNRFPIIIPNLGLKVRY